MPQLHRVLTGRPRPRYRSGRFSLWVPRPPSRSGDVGNLAPGLLSSSVRSVPARKEVTRDGEEALCARNGDAGRVGRRRSQRACEGWRGGSWLSAARGHARLRLTRRHRTEDGAGGCLITPSSARSRVRLFCRRAGVMPEIVLVKICSEEVPKIFDLFHAAVRETA